jgi:hypothetical protein
MTIPPATPKTAKITTAAIRPRTPLRM